ncbi:DUF4315 family protein [Lachnospiraceae bacterium 47-T17]
MNPKIEKLEKEIDKAKTKIAETQAKLRDLEKQKTELENTDYVAIARSFHLTPQQLVEFLKSQQPAPSGNGTLQKEDRNED